MWTQFWDMHSGGGLKEAPVQFIYIEAPEEEAKRVFFARFGHNPERVTCTCCGSDYAIYEGESLAQLTAFHRGCQWNDKTRKYQERQRPGYPPYETLEAFLARENVLVIRAEDIKPEERQTEVPAQGYVWVD